MPKLRPTRRLLADPEHGRGKAQIVDRPGQLSHILWAASRGELGRRNVAVIWMLFGSGMRVNEVAHLLVSDVFYSDGQLKEVFPFEALRPRPINTAPVLSLPDSTEKP